MPSLELELSDDALADIEGAEPPEPPPSPDSPSKKWIRDILLGGNLMVRVGVVVLLFGFAFLVKYAAARDLVPLEIRLAAAFVAGIGLLILGWRLRGVRFGYAVALQGGGIGVMYLTLFASARLFHMVPLSLTFGVMVGLVAFSGLLAVLQDAAAMAVLGAAGGFLAPVLLSTGTGSHVMLFSYYALLNAGIFGIAWFKAWRWLNLVGFAFTFGIGSAWGLQYYRPHHFSTTEPFLILFFSFYLAISVLFARRQPPRLKGYVDGTLVFGTPLVAFSLQVGLVRDMPYGLAFSAVVLGLVYTFLATTLWRRRQNGLETLVEAFLALGVIFASLAIPLALSGSWTAVAWSLEGAGLVWVGVRQRRWPARTFGFLLQIGSGCAFILDSGAGLSGMAVFNGHFLGGMIIGVAGMLSAYFLEHYGHRLHRLERPAAAAIMVWGLLWWFATGLNEIDRRLSHRHELTAALTFVSLSVLVMRCLYRRLAWSGLRWPATGLLPVMALTAAALFGRYDLRHPFQEWWTIAWLSAFMVHYDLLRTMESAWSGKLAAVWHVAGGLLATLLVSWEVSWWLDRLVAGGRVWGFIAWGAVPSAVLFLLIRLQHRTAWPLGRWQNVYRGWLPALLTAALAGWTFTGPWLNGNPRPLPYLPLLNPLDLVQVFVLLAMVAWAWWMHKSPAPPADGFSPVVLWTLPSVGVFIWTSAVVARTVHHMTGIAYHAEVMLRSSLFHAAVAVLWGLMAMGCMTAANRLKHRLVWFVGAGLLALVVIKLFIVDLSGSGTISRIVSFLAVGGLMLVIGFFTPLPPATTRGEGT